MPVLKSKAYSSSQAIENAINYVTDVDKTGIMDFERFIGARSSEDLIQNALNYSANPEKTSLISDGKEEVLVSGYRCKPELAADLFRRTQDTYCRNGHRENVGNLYKKPTLLRPLLDTEGNPILDERGQMIHDTTERSPVYKDENGDPVTFMEAKRTQARVCYMWTMSFAPKEVIGYEIDPKLVHQIGLEFCAGVEEITGLEFPFVCATHVNKHHIHNHIMQSAFSLDGHHKYKDTMDMLNAMREMSDRLSLKYGLPIITEPEIGKSKSYEEWKLIKEGKSWKEVMRQDIAYCVEKSATFEEYLRRIRSLGYDIRETESSITYYSEGKKHRCRDCGLGPEFTKEALMEYFSSPVKAKERPSEIETEEIIDPSKIQNTHKPIKLYVARYTASGRRRTDLEMLLLKAIKLLKWFKDRFSQVDDNSPSPINRSASWKIERLQETIDILSTYQLETVKDLEDKLNEMGAALSHLKKETAFFEQGEVSIQKLKDNLVAVKELQIIADSLGITNLHLPPVTKEQIEAKQAELFPMTAKQRQKLFTLLQDHPFYHLPKFEGITFREAKEIEDYLLNRTDKKPAKLMTDEEFNQYRLRTKYSAIAKKSIESANERFGGQPIPEKLKIQYDTLSLPLEPEMVDFAEAVHLLAYYDRYQMTFKPCGPDDIPVPSAKAEQLKELLTLRGKEINIPVEQLTKLDADRLFNNLLLGMIPPKTMEVIYEKEWQDSLWQLSYEERTYMVEYRALVQELLTSGYDLSRVDTLISDLTDNLNEIDLSKKERDELAAEYRTLRQVKRYIELSTVPQFTNGPRWAKELSEKPEEIEVEQTSELQEPEKEPEPEPQKRKKFNQEIDI